MPRVLYVSSGWGHYLPNILYHGLSSYLGTSKVVDVPYVRRYHLPPEVGEHGPLMNANLRSPGELDEEMLDRLDPELYDLVVLAGLEPGEWAYPAIRVAQKVLSARSDTPIAYVDGEDFDYVRGFYFASRVGCYFKRESVAKTYEGLRVTTASIRILPHFFQVEKRRSRSWLQYPILTSFFLGVNPLPMGVIDWGLSPGASKDIDVSFVARTTNSIRRLVEDSLRQYQRKHPELRVFLSSGLPYIQYMEVLRRSKISVCARGYGFDTMRYWETPYSGAMLLAERCPITIPNDFEDGVSAVFWRDPTEMAEKIEGYLKNDRWEGVATEGRKRLLRFHTSVSRARQVLSTMLK